MKVPYVGLTSYVDIQALDDLYPEICRGFVLSKTKNLSYRGNLSLDENDQNHVNLEAYNGVIKPVWYRYEEFLKLPDNHPIKVSARDLDETQLALFLKYAMGAYDAYQVFPLFSHHEFGTRELSPMADLFENAIKWIDNTNIFAHISKAYFLLIESGGITIEHSDPKYPNPDVLREFIHIRSNLDRPFYVKESKESEKIYVNERACVFNDQKLHGGEPTMTTCYSLRIDGTYTDAFRQIVYKNE
jgi:hypothetical protein